MTIVVEMTVGSVPVDAATAAGCHAGHHEGTDRRTGNERRGSGQVAALFSTTPFSTTAHPYGFRSFRDRRKGADEPVPSPAASASGHPFRAAPTANPIRVRIAAAYGDDSDSSSPILHRIDLCL